MHHMTRKLSIARPARQPAIPPTTAPVLTEPAEPAVEEGVADVMVPVLMMILVGDVNMEVVYKVAAAAGVVDSTVCGTKVGEVNEVEVPEVVVLEDVVEEEVVGEEEVVLGVMEAEDCWVEVGTGVVEVGVVVVIAGAEVVLGGMSECVAGDCVLALVAAEVKIDPIKVGLKRAAKRMWLRISKS